MGGREIVLRTIQGGAIFGYQSHVTIYAISTFQSNTAPGSSGNDIYDYGGTVVFKGCDADSSTERSVSMSDCCTLPSSIPAVACPTPAPTAAPTNDGDTHAPTAAPTGAPTSPTGSPTGSPTDTPKTDEEKLQEMAVALLGGSLMIALAGIAGAVA